MENVSRTFVDAVSKAMGQIRTAISATTINPALLRQPSINMKAI